MVALGTYQRVVINGKGLGSEIWQTGFSTVSTTAFGTQGALQSYANTVAPFVSTWWTSVKANCYPSYQLTGVTVYQYQAPNTAAQFQAQVSIAPVAGTIAGSNSPIDTACVVSLRTAVPGRASRGRMYVPCHAPAAAADGCFLFGTSNGIGTATKAMFNSIVSGTTAAVAVVSRTHNTYELLTSLITDNKPDVQRRRENRLAPTTVQVLAFP